jgi:hypothetical protein
LLGRQQCRFEVLLEAVLAAASRDSLAAQADESGADGHKQFSSENIPFS